MMRNPVAFGRFLPSTASRRKLPLFVPPQMRVAQVSNPTALFENAQYFSPEQKTELQAYGPQVLLGSSEHLLNLAQSLEKQSVQLSQLNRAVFVLTGCHDTLLRETARAAFWQTFGAPVYELLLDFDGAAFASECEAHEGWHIESGLTFSTLDGQLWYRRRRGHLAGTGLTGKVESQKCPCGRAGDRLIQLAMDFQDEVRHLRTA